MRSSIAALAAAVSLSWAGGAGAATFYGPPPDTRFNDGPFHGRGFADFHVESFEHGSLTAPGATATSGFALAPASGETESRVADNGGVLAHLPEPSTWMLLGVGIAGVLFAGKRLAALE